MNGNIKNIIIAYLLLEKQREIFVTELTQNCWSTVR